ncbi:MAG: leucine-rich repeat domain-containing protein [Candidatus Cloacimonadota bacterium]|nr:leucine-rich repeat domain-containing protein [Candidatus Cloacimonadota bacterium]
MKIKVLLIIIISILGLNLFAQLIPDDNFKARINQNLGQPPEYEPTIEDLNGITGMLWAALAGISSIEGAQYLINVTSLYLHDNQIDDISPVSGLTNLTSLLLFYNQIDDISAVSGLINLTSLYLDENQINDICAITGLTNLTSLYLDENQISDISAVSGLTNLTSLHLGNNQISDISAVSGLTNLISLHLHDNQISDISAFSDLINLTSLGISSNQISDISAVSGLTNLTSFGISSNQISDISAVSGLTNLTGLLIGDNQICDISAVSGLTNLTTLRLGQNQISDISAVSYLTNLTYLYLNSDQISDIFALVENTGLGSGDTIFLIENFLSQEALDVHIPILEDRGFNALIYSSNPNVYAACYPNPVRNAIEVPINTTLEWSGNFPSREVNYDVWLGETSEDLLNVGTGTVINNTLYSFTPNLNDNTHYWWRVRATTETDTIWSGLWHFTVGNPVSIDDDLSYLNSSQILRNFPNPFNPITTISFDLPINITNPVIEIFNIKGEKIKQYSISDFQSSIVWDGTNSNHNRVSSGVYLYRLKSEESVLITKKMLLLK